jgi:uncharacterized membrane protein YwzB
MHWWSIQYVSCSTFFNALLVDIILNFYCSCGPHSIARQQMESPTAGIKLSSLHYRTYKQVSLAQIASVFSKKFGTLGKPNSEFVWIFRRKSELLLTATPSMLISIRLLPWVLLASTFAHWACFWTLQSISKEKYVQDSKVHDCRQTAVLSDLRISVSIFLGSCSFAVSVCKS